MLFNLILIRCDKWLYPVILNLLLVDQGMKQLKYLYDNDNLRKYY